MCRYNTVGVCQNDATEVSDMAASHNAALSSVKSLEVLFHLKCSDSKSNIILLPLSMVAHYVLKYRIKRASAATSWEYFNNQD